MSVIDKDGVPMTPSFHRLTIKAIIEETADASSFRLAAEAGKTSLFVYQPGLC